MHEKFEVVQVLFSSRAMIAVPGFGLDRLWCHVSFTAKPKYKPKKPKYTECERHFFGEMVFDPAKDDYHVIFCSIFNSSDPGLRSCVFCPSHEIFAHPAHGCPADGREKIDKFTGGIQMDACQGQMVQCSRLHPMRHACFMDDENEKKKHLERVKKINVGYAKIALGICEEKLGGEFEIVEILSTENKVVVRNESVPEELCHVYFTAKPREVDSCCVSPDYEFLGELLRDNTTNQYKAICCTILKPTDDSPEGFLKEVIRPYDIDGRFSLLEFPSFLITDGTDI